MAEIRQVDKNGDLVPQEAPQSIPNNVREMDGFDYDGMALSQVLGLEKDSERSRYKDDLQHIKDWAKSQGYESPDELKMLIRNLINRLGTPALAENLVTRVSRYAYLQLQSKRIEKEQESLLR